jgi:predicted hydrocarbon binding protein
MGTKTNMIECNRSETKMESETQTKNRKNGKATSDENNEVIFGVRTLMTSPLPACEKLDKMFGSGGEAIVHHMYLESGQNLFDNMIKCNPGKSMEELLKALIDVHHRTGWGMVSMQFIHRNTPMVSIVVKDPPVKTVKGSQKYLIGSFWAGVFSRFFNRQVTCKNFGYDAEKDEFTCTIAT